jgi:hypothetical protein
LKKIKNEAGINKKKIITDFEVFKRELNEKALQRQDEIDFREKDTI